MGRPGFLIFRIVGAMTPDDARAMARAAAQIAALSQPDVAAVIAALPRRPGTTAQLTHLAAASGLEMRVLGKAVARARDAGVLRVDGDLVALDPAGPREAVAALVSMTPLGAALADRPESAVEADYGYLHGVPSGDAAYDMLATIAAELPAGEVDEHEVTTALSAFGDDPAGLRRALVDAGLLWRTRDGSRYRRTVS